MTIENYINDLQKKIQELQQKIEVAKSVNINATQEQTPQSYKSRRLAEISDECWNILNRVDPEAAEKLREEIESKQREKLKHEEFVQNFEKITETRQAISSEEYKKRIQIQLDHELARRLDHENTNNGSVDSIEKNLRPKPSVPPKPITTNSDKQLNLSHMKHAELLEVINDENVDLNFLRECYAEFARRVAVYNEYKLKKNNI